MVDFAVDDNFDFGDDSQEWPPARRGPPIRGFRTDNDRYSNAYANYRGGYGPGGGFGPPMGPPGPRLFRPRGPPGLFGPPRPPPPPPGPMIMWGRGFGPGGPPMQRSVPPETQAFRYLLRCGLSKEVVKSIPKQMILLMEPDYCGVCAMEFDSYAMSRMHYTSRNHTKNQKKWVSQNSKFEGNNEVPLRSRDLYCELCDVHITSKTHAESHYAGKPHRAIVEGRKNPKNPYLLQKGMESRVDQLIRREKKFIKPVEKKPDDPTVPAKPIQSELYCDICKTSMTCSEQMTLHLNGKRHLSKEKQHIIRMMNGKPEQDKAPEAAPGNAEAPSAPSAPSETTEATENQPTENKDDGDWGNGSGVWED